VLCGCSEVAFSNPTVGVIFWESGISPEDNFCAYPVTFHNKVAMVKTCVWKWVNLNPIVHFYFYFVGAQILQAKKV